MKRPAVAEREFPLSNIRDSPDVPKPSHVAHHSQSSKRIKVARLKELPDPLTQRPRNGHRYVTASGKSLYDSRYIWPVDDVEAPKRSQPVNGKAHVSPPKEQQQHQIVNASDEIEEDSFYSKPMINIPTPDHIQAMLVDDWENITKNNQLVPLPHAKPVTKIFEDYLAFERPHRKEGSASMDILDEVVAGFREYFEKALSRILLYRFERHQYMDVRKLWESPDENSKIKSVCDIYGAEHLARLIVSLPELLAQTNMDQQSVSRLREEISKFTAWLGRNCETYFVNEYETPSQEYIDKARSF